METPIPVAAPDPAKPMKWLAPMLLAKMDAPTYCNQLEFAWKMMV